MAVLTVQTPDPSGNGIPVGCELANSGGAWGCILATIKPLPAAGTAAMPPGVVSLNPPAGAGTTLLGAIDAAWLAWVIARGDPNALYDLDVADAIGMAYTQWQTLGYPGASQKGLLTYGQFQVGM